MTKMMATAALAVGVCLTIVSSGMAASGGNSKAQIARGEYLVKAIGQCGDCHTPFDDHGQYVMSKWLQGKKLDFGPLVPMPVWAATSPNIAGLEGWNQDKAVQFFMTGLAPNGQPAGPLCLNTR